MKCRHSAVEAREEDGHALIFNFDYLAYHPVSVRTDVEAPNMKSSRELRKVSATSIG